MLSKKAIGKKSYVLVVVQDELVFGGVYSKLGSYVGLGTLQLHRLNVQCT